MNGKVASNDVRIINGRAYAPISDVATALGMVATKSGNTYEIAIPGGANQLNGTTQGKIGSELFTGKWRFQVTGIETADKYTEQYCQSKKTISAKSDETLVIVRCKLKNGAKVTQTPVLSERMPGNTGLADTNGQSYQPLDYDARQESDKIMSYAAASLLPGAGMDVVLVFSVPEGTTPKALVCTLIRYPDDVPGRGKDVRIELTR